MAAPSSTTTSGTKVDVVGNGGGFFETDSTSFAYSPNFSLEINDPDRLRITSDDNGPGNSEPLISYDRGTAANTNPNGTVSRLTFSFEVPANTTWSVDSALAYTVGFYQDDFLQPAVDITWELGVVSGNGSSRPCGQNGKVSGIVWNP